MNDDDFQKLWINLVERSHREGPPLSEHERHFYTVNLLRGSVPRSGFAGYFENCSGSEIAGAKKGLRALNLEPVLAILEEAQAAILGDRPLPEDSSSIYIFPDASTDEEYGAAAEQLDEVLLPMEKRLFSLDEEIWNALLEFGDAHRLEPRNR